MSALSATSSPATALARPHRPAALSASSVLLRLAAPLAWRSRRRAAEKLQGFAATEAGSSLDMLKAAELSDEPRLRALFLRHAVDEARHARLFRDAARAIDPNARLAPSEYQKLHARRQDLLERHGLVRFVAFVYLAERRGELQFQVLRDYFAGHSALPALSPLFARIAREERFHVAYSRRLLDEWRQAGRGAEVRSALWRVRAARGWEAWRRIGRMAGDLVGRVLLSLVYLLCLLPFALLQRWKEPERSGWRYPALDEDRAPGAALARARRQG
jgi:hypothetical protein